MLNKPYLYELVARITGQPLRHALIAAILILWTSRTLSMLQ